MAFEVGTGYGLPAMYDPNDFISEKRFAGSLKGQVVSLLPSRIQLGTTH